MGYAQPFRLREHRILVPKHASELFSAIPSFGTADAPFSPESLNCGQSLVLSRHVLGRLTPGAVSALLLLCSGCFHFRADNSPRTAKPLPADVASDLKRATSTPPEVTHWQSVTQENYQAVTLSVPVFDAT